MNKTLKSNLFKYFSAAAALIIALPVTARAIPLKEKYKAAAPTYETTESDVLDTPRYASLVAEYEKNGYKNAVTEVAVDSVVPVLNDGKKSVALWQRFCFRKTDGECRFVVRGALYLNGAAHSNNQFLGYGKAKAVSRGCSGRIALI